MCDDMTPESPDAQRPASVSDQGARLAIAGLILSVTTMGLSFLGVVLLVLALKNAQFGVVLPPRHITFSW